LAILYFLYKQILFSGWKKCLR